MRVQWEGKLSSSVCSVFFKLIVSPKWVMGDRPTSDGPPHDQRHHFLISLDPLEEKSSGHTSSDDKKLFHKMKQTRISAMLNLFLATTTKTVYKGQYIAKLPL